MRCRLNFIRAVSGQQIRRFVPGIAIMALDPFEESLDLQQRAFFDLCYDIADQVLVLHRLVVGCHPVVALPVGTPHSYTVDRVLAVGEDGHVTMSRSNVERAYDGRELGALVRLSATFERLGHVPARMRREEVSGTNHSQKMREKVENYLSSPGPK